MAQIQGKQLVDSAISTAKIAASSVTSAKVDSSILVAGGTNPLTADWAVGSHKITGLTDPTGAQDAATKSYTDAQVATAIAGLDPKDPVRVATTAVLETNTRSGNVLTRTGNGALPAQDGVTLVLNDRILVKNEVTAANNGLYFVSAVGSGAAPWTLTRTTDADSSAEVTTGMYTLVKEGTTYLYSAFFLTTPDPIVLNTTALTFIQFSGVGSLTFGPAVNVGAANAPGVLTSLSHSDHIHAAPVPVTGNKNMTASVTVSDNDAATATTVVKANALGGYIGVRVNGINQLVGDGTKVSVDCYFSGDGGVTARAMSAVAVADTLRWNGSVAGFQLAATDRIDITLDAF